MLIFPHILLPISLIGLSLKDLKEKIIPDGYVLMVGGLGLWGHGGTYMITGLVLGGLGAALALIHLKLKGYPGLGWGDVKLMAASGFWIPLSSVPLFLIITGGSGMITALIWRVRNQQPPFPLGPSLALALGSCVLKDALFDGDIYAAFFF